MKKIFMVLVISLFIITGCEGDKHSSTQDNGLITVDVTAKYPKKELILQDFLDVEYIPLETTDEFVCQGRLQDVGKNYIIVKNYVQDGNIFVFDRKGKALKRINRKGQGHEEYTDIVGITLDEDAGELFVNDYMTRKICVYDLDGNFKRNFKYKERESNVNIYNFNQESLIYHNGSSFNKGQSFWIISKQDGSILKEIHIPFEEKKFARLTEKDEATGVSYILTPATDNPLIPSFDHWVLVELSSDTVYRYSSDHTMTPVIARTPSIQSMDPEVFLFVGTITDRYYFMEASKKVGDVVTQTGFPSTHLVYDKKEKKLFQYIVYTNDYSIKKSIFINYTPINNNIASWNRLEAHDLVGSYERGELKGKLKEAATELNEDSNPVIMLMTHKK